MVAAISARRPRTLSIGTVVVGACIAIASALAVSVGYTLHSAEDAERALPSIVERDVTAIAHATVLRSDLRQIEQMLAESAEGRPWEPGSMHRMLESVDHETTFARTAYPDDIDARLRGAAFDAIALARSRIDSIRTLLDTGDVAGARGAMVSALRPQFRQADAAIAMLSQSSVDQIGRAASDQADALRRATRIALLLDALCVLVALGLGALAILAVRREHARLRAQLAELEIFADRVAHDIRGPLAPVSLALQIAARSATDSVSSAIERGQRSLRVVVEIIDGLHSFARSRAESHEHGHTDVRPVIEDVVSEAMREAEQDDVQLAVLDIEDTIVDCGPGVLASIVSNLLRNAIRHMGPRSTRRATISVHVHNRYAAIVVQDTGPGLPAGFEERAFLPYTRPDGAQRPGLGLGLATVKRLAEGHGGSVHVDSTATGCVFVVELPIWHAEVVRSRAEPIHG
jgi:signal transduction histidine kinase